MYLELRGSRPRVRLRKRAGSIHRSANMTRNIAVLSALPRLSYHLRERLPSLNVFDVQPGKENTLSKLNTAEILVADCDLLIPYADKLSSVKWVQSTWAGLDKLTGYLRDKDVNYLLTRFSGKSFGFAMSEYVVAQIFNYERDQRIQYENQKNCVWSQDGKIHNHRLICDLKVGVLGLGNIGKTIAQNLKLFGANVWGLTRTPLKEKLDFLDEHRTIDSLPEVLRNCHYIINVLPSTQQTIGLLNKEVLKNCKDIGTVFINIGRGSIIKESDLVKALEEKWINAAILDVHETEPLPKDSKLWNLPQVTISPHVSGVTRVQDVAKFFTENYHKFVKGEPLSNVFNWQSGY